MRRLVAIAMTDDAQWWRQKQHADFVSRSVSHSCTAAGPRYCSPRKRCDRCCERANNERSKHVEPGRSLKRNEWDTSTDTSTYGGIVCKGHGMELAFRQAGAIRTSAQGCTTNVYNNNNNNISASASTHICKRTAQQTYACL